jgi:hypothetical protein
MRIIGAGAPDALQPGMISDARIRLEGKLDAVENAEARLKLAVADVKAGRWPAVAALLNDVDGAELACATRAVRAMASTEPQLARALRRLANAREALERSVAARAQLLGIPAGPAPQQVRTLIDDAVIFEQWLENPARIIARLLLPPALCFAALVSWSWQPLCVVPIVLLCAQLFGKTFVRVSRDRLVIDGASLPVRELKRAHTRYVSPGFTLYLETQTTWHAFHLPWIPQQLIDALAAHGVPSQRYEWPFEGHESNDRKRFK